MAANITNSFFPNNHELKFSVESGKAAASLYKGGHYLGTCNLDSLPTRAWSYKTLSSSDLPVAREALTKLNHFLTDHQVLVDRERVSIDIPPETTAKVQALLPLIFPHSFPLKGAVSSFTSSEKASALIKALNDLEIGRPVHDAIINALGDIASEEPSAIGEEGIKSLIILFKSLYYTNPNAQMRVSDILCMISLNEPSVFGKGGIEALFNALKETKGVLDLSDTIEMLGNIASKAPHLIKEEGVTTLKQLLDDPEIGYLRADVQKIVDATKSTAAKK